ncbi:hypothetical protein B0T18DRAFT_386353 [Schizothecium vesticola]|uniref:Uncharacterized protein n=1 Tax=Schizothecium vesticola TaxID=314040 RepID=A0AA40KD42_9PEZI|nr:hypothetical protein B0T18DRAFT_386353 [Schizothecium vesticola]
MAANTNPSPSRPPRDPPAISMSKEEVEQLMLDIMDPLDINRYEESNPTTKGKKRKAFRQKLRTCVDAYPQIESTTKMLTAFWGRLQVALGVDKSLAQDAALLASYMGTEPGATWAPDVNPIVESTFTSITMLSRLPSLQDWEQKNGQMFKVPGQLRQMIELAKDFLEALHPVMEYAVSGTGRAVAPPSRLLRAILAKQPFMAINPPNKLSDMLKEDIKTMAFLLSIPRFSDNATRKGDSGPGMDTLQNTGGMEQTGGGPTPYRNTPPLPLPSNALTQRESTVATPRALTSTASAPALGSGMSSQSMLYSAKTMPPQRVPGAAYLASQSNAMPQMATTIPAPASPFTNTHPAMGASAMGMPATGTSSRPWPSTQSMPTRSHTITEPALDTLDDLDQDMLDGLASCADMTLEEMGDILDGYHLEPLPLAPPAP